MNYFDIRSTRLFGAGKGAQITTSTTVPTGLIKPAGAVGMHLGIVTNPMLVQLCPKISKVFFYNGTTFTDLTDALTLGDPNLTTGTTLNSWDTLANSDCLFVGIDKDAGAGWAASGLANNFKGCRGLWVDIVNTNTTAATLAVAYSKVATTISGADLVEVEAGSAEWASTTETDNTAAGGATLNSETNPTITWTDAQTDWGAATINGHQAYWLRLAVSAALDATVSLTGLLALSKWWTQNSVTIAALIPAGVGPFELMFNTVLVGGIELLGVTGAGTAYVNWLIP